MACPCVRGGGACPTRGIRAQRGEQGTVSELSSQALLEGKGSRGQPRQGGRARVLAAAGKVIPGPSALPMGVHAPAGAKRCCSEPPGLGTVGRGSAQCRQGQGCRQNFWAAQGEGCGCLGCGAAKAWEAGPAAMCSWR